MKLNKNGQPRKKRVETKKRVYTKPKKPRKPRAPKKIPTGNRYGKLTALEFSHMDRTKEGAYYHFLCDCGNRTIKSGRDVRGSRTKSCGCLYYEKIVQRTATDHTEIFNRKIYKQYQKIAEKKKLEFKLTLNEFYELTQKSCFYCDQTLNNTCKQKLHNKIVVYHYNGVDRNNNKLGYIKNNVISCCKKCNYAKTNLLFDDFINHHEKISNYKNDGTKLIRNNSSIDYDEFIKNKFTNAIFSSYKNGAKIRNLEFLLSESQVEDLCNQLCQYIAETLNLI